MESSTVILEVVETVDLQPNCHQMDVVDIEALTPSCHQ